MYTSSSILLAAYKPNLQRSGHLTANARVLGTKQAEGFKTHAHLAPTPEGNTGTRYFIYGSAVDAYDYEEPGGRLPTTSTGGAETRPINIALHPRIQI